MNWGKGDAACLPVSSGRCFRRNYMSSFASFEDRVLFCIQHDEDNEKHKY